MRQELWQQRADMLAQYSGKSLTITQVSEMCGLSRETVSKYADLYGFDFSKPVVERGRPRGLRIMEERAAAIKACAEAGKTRQEAAQEVGLAYPTVVIYALRYGIEFRHASAAGPIDASRTDAMASMYKSGKTLLDIGSLYGVSRERVRQLISKTHGLTAKDGGQHASAERARESRQAKKEAWSFDKYGCSVEQYKTLLRVGKDMVKRGIGRDRAPTFAWRSQKQNAKARGVEWDLKIWDWWQIWQASGQWENRGRERDNYVMCRFGDTGPYTLGNVYIAPVQHNISIQPNNPYRKSHPDHDKVVYSRRMRMKRNGLPKTKKSGLPLGVTISNGRYQAQICIAGRNKYLGYFKTPEEAHACYLEKLAEISAPLHAAE